MILLPFCSMLILSFFMSSAYGYRRGVLDAYIFEDIHQVREQTDIWVNDYNHKRPHESLGNIPPVLYAKNHLGVPLDDF